MNRQTIDDIGVHAVRALPYELVIFIFLKSRVCLEFVRVCVQEDKDR